MENPILPLIKEAAERCREATMFDNEEGIRSSLLEVYHLYFLNIKITEGQLNNLAHIIKEYYEKEGNSRALRRAKRIGSKLYLYLIEQKQLLSEVDDLTSKLWGLE